MKQTLKTNIYLRKIVLFIYLIIISTTLSSCVGKFGGKEINKIAIVTSMALDYEDEMFIVTCEVANPQLNSNSNESLGSAELSLFSYPQGRGNSVSQAINSISLHFDKQLFLSHSNLLFIGEDLAKKGIGQGIDFFLRDNGPREDMYVVVVKEGKAYDAIGVRAGSGKSSRNYLYAILNNFPSNGKSMNIQLSEYFRYFYDEGNYPVLGVVQVEKEKKLDAESQEKEPMEKILDVSGGAVLKKDKLLGYFDSNEMMGYNFIVNELREGLISFEAPESIKNNKLGIGTAGKFITINILNSNTKNNIAIEDGKVHLTINIKNKVSIDEINENIDINMPNAISLMEEVCSEKIKEKVSLALEKAKNEFKGDCFGIGMAFHRQYPELWKSISGQWHSIFSEISYDINVETTIVKMGLINTPANERKRK